MTFYEWGILSLLLVIVLVTNIITSPVVTSWNDIFWLDAEVKVIEETASADWRKGKMFLILSDWKQLNPWEYQTVLLPSSNFLLLLIS